MGLFKKKPKSVVVNQNGKSERPAGAAQSTLDVAMPEGIDLPNMTPAQAAAVAAAKAAAEAAAAEGNAPANKKGKPPKAPKAAPPPKPAKPAKPAKADRKGGVSVAEFAALRDELVSMKTRLDASESARAVVEARLASLDATASAFTSERSEIADVAAMVMQLQNEIHNMPEKAAAASGGFDDSAWTADELSAKVDALNNRILGMHDSSGRIAEFEGQLAEMARRLEQAAATAEAANNAATAATAVANTPPPPPPPPMPTGPDQDTVDRLNYLYQRLSELDGLHQRMAGVDHIHQRLGELDHVHQRLGELDDLHQQVAAVDAINAQLHQLNARITAQAEFGSQLGALRDKVAEMSGGAPVAAAVDDDTRLRLTELGEKMAELDAMQSQIAQLAERVAANDNEARSAREHMAALDQRLSNVSVELANQLSELGRDIDGLAQQIPEVASGNVSDEVVDALRGGQTKLANEQARYEIAFRQDLAELAERIRRGAGQ